MTRRPLATLSLAGLTLSLGGCSLLSAPSAEVGECVQMADLQAAEVQDIPTVDCTEEHDGQVVSKFVAPAGDYPTDEEWQTIIQDGCTGGFEEYVGTSYDESSLNLQDLSPTEEGWDADDRSVICIGYLDGETTTESFENAEI